MTGSSTKMSVIQGADSIGAVLKESITTNAHDPHALKSLIVIIDGKAIKKAGEYMTGSSTEMSVTQDADSIGAVLIESITTNAQDPHALNSLIANNDGEAVKNAGVSMAGSSTKISVTHGADSIGPVQWQHWRRPDKLRRKREL